MSERHSEVATPLTAMASAWTRFAESAVKGATAANRAALSAFTVEGYGDVYSPSEDEPEEVREGSVPSLAYEELDWTFERTVDSPSNITVGDTVTFEKEIDDDDVRAFARASGFPVVADPLSGHRFGPHTADIPVCGGYDGYVSVLESTPDVVVRFGASPTSKPLRRYLRDSGARQFVVDPAGGWREATFTATDLLVADPTRVAADLAEAVDRDPGAFAADLAALEDAYWSFVAGEEPPEGAVLADALALAPDPATVFASNSMPVRDLDRFGRPREAEVTVLGNRGASGIDGITSTALGAGRGTDDPLVLVTGDLAYYHDMNGLLAVARAGVDATIVCLNNDGGGIFHLLPIEDHGSFEAWFRTPHGLEFEHSAALYDLEFARTDDRSRFRELYADSVGAEGTQVIEYRTDSGRNHDDRRELEGRVAERLG